MTHTVQIKVHLRNVLLQAARELPAGFGMSFQIVDTLMCRIAEIANELEHDELQEIMFRLAYLSDEKPTTPHTSIT